MQVSIHPAPCLACEAFSLHLVRPAQFLCVPHWDSKTLSSPPHPASRTPVCPQGPQPQCLPRSEDGGWQVNKNRH